MLPFFEWIKQFLPKSQLPATELQEDDVVDAVFEEYYRLLVENGINVD